MKAATLATDRPRLRVNLKKMHKKAAQMKKDRDLRRAIEKEREKAEDIEAAKREYPGIIARIQSCIQDAVNLGRTTDAFLVRLVRTPVSRTEKVMSKIRQWIEEDYPAVTWNYNVAEVSASFTWTAPAGDDE